MITETSLLPANYTKRVKMNDNDLARRLTKKGSGVSMLSEFGCATDLRDGLLVPVLRGHRLVEKNIYPLYPSNLHLSVKVNKMIQFLFERWKNNPPW